jgi:hypothetical protein
VRTEELDKDRDFASPETVDRLLARTDWNSANAAFLERLRPVHAQVLRDLR